MNPCRARNEGGASASTRQSAAPTAPVASVASRTTCSAVSASSAPATRASPSSSSGSARPLPPARSARPFEPHGDADVRRREAPEHALAPLERRVAGGSRAPGSRRSARRPGWGRSPSFRPRAAATSRIAAGSPSSELDVDDSSCSESSPSRFSREPSSSAARADDSARTARATRHPSSGAIVRTMTRSLPVAAAAASARAVERFGERAVLEQPPGGPVEALEQLLFPFVCDPPHDRIMRLCAARTGCGPAQER